VPRASDRFEAASLQFEVVDMDRNRVDKILVSSAAESEGRG
jgi:CBS domain containing-hemolysin-like protein